MLYRQRELRHLAAQIADTFLLGFALWAAHAIRYEAGMATGLIFPPIQGFDAFHPLLIFAMLPGPFILDACSVYRHTLLDGPKVFFMRLGQALFLILVLMVLLIYLFKMADLARGVVILFALVAFGLLSIRHFFFQGLLDFFFHGRSLPQAVLLVGEPTGVEQFRAIIESQNEVHMTVVGIVNRLQDLEGEISDWLHRAPISGVIFSVPHTAFEEIEKAINVCELEGVEAWVVTDYIQTQISRPTFQHFHGHPVLVFASREVPGWQIMAKRMMDILISLVVLVVILPLMAVIAVLIRLESSGPSLFVQERSGQRGRVFWMYKFRSMVSNAAMKQAELAVFNEMEGPVFKITKDPRLTRLGGFLRRTSLDELPQFWNILKGDMSLVGPRPLPVYETQRIQNWSHRRRLSVKPGLTCLWQISGRNQVRSFEDWAKLDLEYVDHWSIWMDLKILAKTIPIVLTGSGAR